MEENTFLMMMHLSQFAAFLVLGAGIVLPIVMWATNKDQSQEVDRHGKIIFNWIISYLIYIVISAVLVLIVVGVVALIALVIVDLIFVIMAAVKANDGKLWHYPLSIKFFSVE